MQPDPALLNDFLAQRTSTPKGASLRDPELATRMFRYRCSYMIYSRGFSEMPAEMKKRVFEGLALALQDHGKLPEFDYLPATEKEAIREILQTTGVPIGSPQNRRAQFRKIP